MTVFFFSFFSPIIPLALVSLCVQQSPLETDRACVFSPVCGSTLGAVSCTTRRAAVWGTSWAFAAILAGHPPCSWICFSGPSALRELHKNMTGPAFVHGLFQDDAQCLSASRKSASAPENQSIEEWLHLLKLWREAPLGTILIFIYETSLPRHGVFFRKCL